MNFRIILMWFLTMTVLVGISNAEPGMIYERWDTAGTPDPLLTDTSTPDYSEIVLSAQWGYQDDDSLGGYVGRLTGYIVPLVTGNYTFWLLTDDNGRLWLSTDADPANAALIATETGWLGQDAWAAVGDETVSAPIALVGGNIYWIRGAYQETGGGDHIRIGWASTEAGIADHTLIGDPYVWTALPTRAYAPDPADGEWFRYSTDVTQLAWTNPPSLTGGVITCDVLWWDKDPNEPGATYELLVEGGAVESVLLNGKADTPAHYWWQVDCYDPNDQGEPTKTVGDVWTFSSARDVPVVFLDESDGSTALSEQDPIPDRDDYVLSLSMDPGVAVSITVVEQPNMFNPLTDTKETMESYNGSTGEAPLLWVTHSGGAVVLVRISNGADDVEQDVSGGGIDVTSSDLEFFDDGGDQIIGLRFNTVAIPQGVTIDSAIIEFVVDETENSGEVHGLVTGEYVGNAPALAATTFEFRDRLAANATIATSTFIWTADYAVDDKVPTADFASVIQEIVDRPDWALGNSMVLFITEDMGPDPADIDFIDATDPWALRSETYVLDSSNWQGVTVTIAAIDDDDLETDPDLITLTARTSSTDPDWTGLPVPEVIVSIGENECGAWLFESHDFNKDCYIDMADLAMLIEDWLTCTTPNVGGCIPDYRP